MLDFNHGSARPRGGVPTVEMLDQAAARLNTGKSRNYLGGSRLGEECARKLQYEYEGAERPPFPARTQLIFDAGHAGEDSVARLLKQIFDLRTHQANGGQFGFTTANDRIKGHIDGVICGGPEEFGPYPFLWEHKEVGAKYWQAIGRNGVRAERPVYAGQIATYQAYLDLTDNPALFSFGNRDTREIGFERVPFDAKLAQECTDRGVQVITATERGERLPRPYASADFFKCRFCDYREACWA